MLFTLYISFDYISFEPFFSLLFDYFPIYSAHFCNAEFIFFPTYEMLHFISLRFMHLVLEFSFYFIQIPLMFAQLLIFFFSHTLFV